MPFRPRANAVRASPANPSTIIAHVEGSGTEVRETVPRAKSLVPPPPGETAVISNSRVLIGPPLQPIKIADPSPFCVGCHPP